MQHIEKLAIEAHCETIALEVRVSNKSAISLYKKCGFEIINTKKITTTGRVSVKMAIS